MLYNAKLLLFEMHFEKRFSGIDKNEIDIESEIKTCGLQRCNATDWRDKVTLALTIFKTEETNRVAEDDWITSCREQF
jgi:hypothetical protein